MLLRHFFIISLLFTSYQLFAQLDESDTSRFQFRATLTGKHQTGNVEIFQLKGKLDASTRFGSLALKSENKLLYQEFSRSRVDNNWSSRNWFYYKPERKFYPLLLSFLSTNFRRKVDSRWTIGGGLTWQILTRSDHVLKLSGGLFHEFSRFEGQQFNEEKFNGDRNLNIARTAIYLFGSHRFNKGPISLYYQGFFEPAIQDIGNYRIDFEMGLDTKLIGSLSLRVAYRYTYEDVVVIGVEQQDGLLTFGLTFVTMNNEQ